MKIDDSDALDILEKLEGKAWRKQQENDRQSDYGFYAYLNAWKEIVEAGEEGECSPRELLKGDGAIYGNGGVARYVVTQHGEIVLLRWSTHWNKIKSAEAFGVKVSP